MSGNNGPSGFLTIDKPSGITSFDVIRELRRMLRIRKMGHSGVLDKPATGVLVVGINRATRLFQHFAGFEKSYTGEFILGMSTTTDDLAGELSAVSEQPLPTREQFAAMLAQYTGELQQIPPAFSLTKVGGRELYRYALAGEEVEVQPKQVEVISSELLDFESGLDPKDVLWEDSQLLERIDEIGPLARARVRVLGRGGVYIRSLTRDVAADLGSLGCMGRLRRESVGPFSLDDAMRLEDVAARLEEGATVEDLLEPLGAIANGQASLQLDAQQCGMLRNGMGIRCPRKALPPGSYGEGDTVFALDGRELVAVLQFHGVTPQGLVELRPEKVLG
ncbi:MAG: tRNA pseudouridine(55) synthase TruB [Planctomycetales bacterium]|nr:tRNA pseudouridine(55) synthase TruB [bacterium]UNM09764.1 MAG: tRNA pseudouridine(55) synthase TruB [Planctomycetales bacterium]